MLNGPSSSPGDFMVSDAVNVGAHTMPDAVINSYTLSYRPIVSVGKNEMDIIATPVTIKHCAIERDPQSNMWKLLHSTAVGNGEQLQFATVAKLIQYYRSRALPTASKAKTILHHVSATPQLPSSKIVAHISKSREFPGEGDIDTIASNRVPIMETSFTAVAINDDNDDVDYDRAIQSGDTAALAAAAAAAAAADTRAVTPARLDTIAPKPAPTPEEAEATAISVHNFIKGIERDIEGVNDLVSMTNEEDAKESAATASSVHEFITRLERNIAGVRDVVLTLKAEDAASVRTFAADVIVDASASAGAGASTGVNTDTGVGAGAGADASADADASTGAGAGAGPGDNAEYLEVIGAVAAAAAAAAADSATEVEEEGEIHSPTASPSRQQHEPSTRMPPELVNPMPSLTRIPAVVDDHDDYERTHEDDANNNNDYANADETDDATGHHSGGTAPGLQGEMVLVNYVPCLNVEANQSTSKFVAPVMVLGKNTLSAQGLATIMGVHPKTYRDIRNKLAKIRKEFKKSGTAEDNANIAGLLAGTYANPETPGDFLPSVAEVMRSSPEIEIAGLEIHHVLALRLYTTSSYKSINGPMRQQPYPQLPHPFAATLYYISDALTKLRTVQGATQSHENKQQIFWRGMIDLRVTDEFLEVGGTEMSCMSTTSSQEVAADFAKKSKTSPLLFKLISNDFMSHGADISFLSVYPKEKEILYPPLTYLGPTSRERTVVVIDGVEYQVVEVTPTFGSLS